MGLLALGDADGRSISILVLDALANIDIDCPLEQLLFGFLFLFSCFFWPLLTAWPVGSEAASAPAAMLFLAFLPSSFI